MDKMRVADHRDSGDPDVRDSSEREALQAFAQLLANLAARRVLVSMTASVDTAADPAAGDAACQHSGE